MSCTSHYVADVCVLSELCERLLSEETSWNPKPHERRRLTICEFVWRGFFWRKHHGPDTTGTTAVCGHHGQDGAATGSLAGGGAQRPAPAPAAQLLALGGQDHRGRHPQPVRGPHQVRHADPAPVAQLPAVEAAL